MGLRETYLAGYNALQFIGWAASLTALLSGSNHAQVYDKVYVFQALALLEIVHVLFGLVRAELITTVIQVFSRIQVLLVHYLVSDARLSNGNHYMLLAWCLVEVIRYPFLCMKSISTPPYALVWLRYSAFYVLYPLGVYGEMVVLNSSLPSITLNKTLSISMPNVWNFEFNFASYLTVLLYVVYLPGLLFQYSHMIRQRRNALSVDKKAE